MDKYAEAVFISASASATQQLSLNNHRHASMGRPAICRCWTKAGFGLVQQHSHSHEEDYEISKIIYRYTEKKRKQMYGISRTVGDQARRKCLARCLGLLCSTFFFSFAPCFLAKRFLLHALSSRKKRVELWDVLYKLQFFVELLHSGVCGAEFVEQSQTPPKYVNPTWAFEKVYYL